MIYLELHESFAAYSRILLVFVSKAYIPNWMPLLRFHHLETFVVVGGWWCLNENLVIGFGPNLGLALWPRAKPINVQILELVQTLFLAAYIAYPYIAALYSIIKSPRVLVLRTLFSKLLISAY